MLAILAVIMLNDHTNAFVRHRAVLMCFIIDDNCDGCVIRGNCCLEVEVSKLVCTAGIEELPLEAALIRPLRRPLPYSVR